MPVFQHTLLLRLQVQLLEAPHPPLSLIRVPETLLLVRVETKSLTSQPFASQPANPPASHSPANPPAANPPASRPGALCSLQGKPSFFIDSVPDPVRTFGNRSSGRACFATSQTKYCYFCCAGPRPWCVHVIDFTRHVLQQVKRNIAILSLPALTPNGVDSDVLQQVN